MMIGDRGSVDTGPLPPLAGGARRCPNSFYGTLT
jgi:hypothetical protein